MRPVDPRLLRYARSTRVFLAAAVIIGTVSAALIVAQALLLADVITAVFQQGAGLAEMAPQLRELALVIVLRAGVAYAAEWAAFRAAAQAKSELREALLEHAVALGPVALGRRRSGELATLATRGIDALDAYYARYLPQLVLAIIVPLVIGLTILGLDVLAAVIVGLTLGLIPLFLILIGWYTQTRVDRQWRTLGMLSGHFLDVVAGLPTLAVFGRARAQAENLRAVGEQYRAATMKVLRVSFLSSLALELVATLSVALVAVSIGLRLVNGDMTLEVGLAVLILAPEAYLPLRMVGVHFHAAAEGLGAAGKIFDVLDEEPPVRGTRTDVPDLATTTITLDDVTVTYGEGRSAALEHASLTLRPGRVTALVGPSGGGKSTVLALLLGFVGASGGQVRVGDLDLADVDPDVWRSHLAWLPQTPHLSTGTVGDDVRLGRPEATDAQVAEALAAAGIPVDDPALPAGLATRVGEGSSGLSVGQRRRVALARALLRDAPLVLLDEPTAALDADTEMLVVEAVRLLREAGRTVVVVAHRPALVALADDVVDIAAAQRRQGDAAAQRRQGDAAAQRRVGRDDADVPPAEVGA